MSGLRLEMTPWGTIPSFPKYEASTDGDIRRVGRRVLKPSVSAGGYARVALSRKGKRFNKLVHRLVAEAFLEDWDPALTVDHINNKARGSNRISNLRMATRTQQNANRDNSNNSKGNRRRVEQLSLVDGTVVAEYESMTEATKAAGGSTGGISKCISRETKSSAGYGWRFHVAETDADLDGEIWKRWLDTKVHLSNFGRVKRLTRNGWTTVKAARDMCAGNGYPVFMADGVNVSLHRAVALTFIDPSDDPEAIVPNHKDGDKLNAVASNLEWATPSANSQHAHDTGLNKTKKAVTQSLDGKIIAAYESVVDAARHTGFMSASSISAALTGRQKTAGGFTWEYTSPES